MTLAEIYQRSRTRGRFVVALRASGLKLHEIGDKIGVGVECVRHIIQREGVRDRKELTEGALILGDVERKLVRLAYGYDRLSSVTRS